MEHKETKDKMQTKHTATQRAASVPVGIGGTIALIVLGLSVNVAQATLLLHDDINGTAGNPPDNTKWAVLSGSVTLDGNGFADFNGGSELRALPAFNFAPQPGVADYDVLRLRIGFTNALANTVLGFYTGGSDQIFVRDDQAIPSNPDWIVQVSTAAGNGFYDTGLTHASPSSGVWEIDWTLGRVKVLLNGTQLFDSNSSPLSPGSSVGSWIIPTAPLRPDAIMYTGSGVLGGLDFVNFDTIPEPSVAVLGGVALLMVWLRRRQ